MWSNLQPNPDYHWSVLKASVDAIKCTLKTELTYEDDKLTCTLSLNDTHLVQIYGHAATDVTPYTIISAAYKTACYYLMEIGRKHANKENLDDCQLPYVEFLPSIVDNCGQSSLSSSAESSIDGSECVDNENLDCDTQSTNICRLSDKIKSMRLSITKKLQEFAIDHNPNDCGGSTSSQNDTMSFCDSVGSADDNHSTIGPPETTNADVRPNSWISLGGYGIKFGSAYDKDSVSIASDSDCTSSDKSKQQQQPLCAAGSANIFRRDILKHRIDFDIFNPTNTFENNEIGDENLGYQMMRLIGWSGGSLGLDGNGIVEPIGIGAVKKDRNGIGKNKSEFFDSKMKLKSGVLTSFLREYASNRKQITELKLSLEFDRKELLVLKQRAKKMELDVQEGTENNDGVSLIIRKPSGYCWTDVAERKRIAKADKKRVKTEKKGLANPADSSSLLASVGAAEKSNKKKGGVKLSSPAVVSNVVPANAITRADIARAENVYRANRDTNFNKNVIYNLDSELGKKVVSRFLRLYAEDQQQVDELIFSKQIRRQELSVLVGESKKMGLNLADLRTDNSNGVALKISKPIGYCVKEALQQYGIRCNRELREKRLSLKASLGEFKEVPQLKNENAI